MTVCNVNQVEASFLDEFDMFGDVKKINVLIKQFFTGSNETLNKADQNLTDRINEKLSYYGTYPVHAFSRQACRDMFKSIEFRGRSITWNEMPSYRFYEVDIGSTLLKITYSQ